MPADDPDTPADPAAEPHRNVVAVTEAAHRLGVHIQPVTYPDGTRTAQDAADAIGCSVAQIVKSLIFAVAAGGDTGDTDEVVVALVSGANQLDEKKLAAAAGAGKAKRVDADRVRDATGFPIGGVPPFGHRRALRVFVDSDLLAFDETWAAAGTPHAVFAIAPQQLIEVSAGIVVDLRRDA